MEKNSNNTNNNLNKNDSEAEKIASNGTEVKGNSTDSQENLSNSIKNGQNNGRNMTVDENVAKIGPSEDYDLVKQRLCERKKVIIYWFKFLLSHLFDVEILVNVNIWRPVGKIE